MVRIVLEQPAAARFLVRKLYHFLVSEKAAPPDSLLEPLCESFRKSDYDIAGLVRTILASRHFYSGHAFRQRIKGPVEYVLGAVQAVYRRYGEEEADYRPLPQQVLVGRLECDGAAPVRAAQRQGLAGRPVLAEYLHGAGARQLRRGPGDGHALAQPVAGADRQDGGRLLRRRGRVLGKLTRSLRSPTRPRSRRRPGPSTRPGSWTRRA